MEPFAVVIVTFFPSNETVSRLLQYAKICNLLIVVDNTDSGPQIQLEASAHIILIRNKRNEGLAAALNKGVNIAGQYGYEKIFLFDQDTIVNNWFFLKMSVFISKYEAKKNKYVMFVPNFYDRNSKTFAKFILLTTYTLDHVNCRNLPSKYNGQAVIAITSGTCILYSQFKAIGPFKEDYFIDFIDHEYCLRSAARGYKTIINCDIVISHAIGKRTVHNLLGFTFKPNSHPPVRKYYFARNGIRTAISYFHVFPFYSLLVSAHIMHDIFAVALFEKNKNSKVKAIFYGIFHGLINKKGKSPISYS